MTKKDLEKLGLNHSKLMEDHHYLNTELNALKSHANVLESQNYTLHN